MVTGVTICYSWGVRARAVSRSQGTAPEADMSIIPNGNSAKVTVPELLQRKSTAADSTNKKKITCLPAYDYPTARLMDGAGGDGGAGLREHAAADAGGVAAPHEGGAARRAAGAGGGRHAVWHVPGRHQR